MEELAKWGSLHGVLNGTTRKIQPMSENALILLKRFTG